MWYIVYKFVLMKNDTFDSVIICYHLYHNDFNMFFVLWWKCSCMIYVNFNILVVVYCDYYIIRRKHWYTADVCPRCKGIVSE